MAAQLGRPRAATVWAGEAVCRGLRVGGAVRRPATACRRWARRQTGEAMVRRMAGDHQQPTPPSAEPCGGPDGGVPRPHTQG